MSERAAAAPEFLITKEYRRFAEFCDACRRYQYIGLCYGPPGVGKTLSARHYANWDLLTPHIDFFTAQAPAPLELLVARTLLYTPAVTTSPRAIGREIDRLELGLRWALLHISAPPTAETPTSEVATPIELIVVDEADRLNMSGLEQLRDIYDRRHLGLIFIGMPGLEKRLARYPQLYSRVGFVHHYRPLATEELYFILQRKWEQLGLTLSADDFTDVEAIAAVTRITTGNFRLLQRLFTQIERILQINQIRTITKEVVEAAQEGLVIGPL